MDRDALRRTTITEAEFEAAFAKVREHIAKHGSVNNKELRALARFSFDQGIRFFKIATDRGLLVRVGKSSATKYVLPDSPEAAR
jgi:hypothetical protein